MSHVILVTGASRGLGRAVAEAALAAGHRVLATARRPESLDGLAAAHPAALRTAALDVTDPAAAERAVRAATEAFGDLDTVVNNAGYADTASVEDMPLEDFRAQIETNLLGVVNVTKAALPVLRARGGGSIVQVSSVGGRVATPGLSAYQAAKWAVGGFSDVLALEVAPLGIKVTTLEPGGMPTDWAGSSMRIHPVSPPYEATVGRSTEALRGMRGPGPDGSGTAEVARVLLSLLDMPEPPRRLLLGRDAVSHAGAAAAARADADAHWRTLSESTSA
jgi:NAD(P)-dependent dehydrogenase (short-subunit alcohol dehydrogenase family)